MIKSQSIFFYPPKFYQFPLVVMTTTFVHGGEKIDVSAVSAEHVDLASKISFRGEK